MVEFKETVTKTHEQGVDEMGAVVNQETRKVDTTSTASSRSMIVNGVWFIVGLIDVLLGIRFTLKLLGANQTSGFVDFIYGITDILTAPFDSMFGVSSATSGEVNSVFEPSIIVAAIVYTLIGWGIVKLLTLNRTV